MFRAQVDSSIEAKSSFAKSKNVLFDWKSYPHWNPYIQKIEGTPAVGEKIKVYFNLGFGVALPLTCKLTKFDTKEGLFAWTVTAGSKHLYWGEHSFALNKGVKGKTELVQSEKMSGLLGNRYQWFYHAMLKGRFSAMNQAFKERVETVDLGKS